MPEKSTNARIDKRSQEICGGLQVRIIRIEKENFEHQQKCMQFG